MTLRLLLDEQISHVVASEVRRHRPALVIESVHTWKGGALRSQPDYELLHAAASEDWTLVTYDLNSIPAILPELFSAGLSHGGILFVDERTVASDDFGMLTRALIHFWDRHQALDWRGRIHFLDRPQR